MLLGCVWNGSVFARIRPISPDRLGGASYECGQQYALCSHGPCAGVLFFRKRYVKAYYCWEKRQRILDESFISVQWKWILETVLRVTLASWKMLRLTWWRLIPIDSQIVTKTQENYTQRFVSHERKCLCGHRCHDILASYFVYVYCLTVSIGPCRFVLFGLVPSYSREFDFAPVRFHCIHNLMQEPLQQRW